MSIAVVMTITDEQFLDCFRGKNAEVDYFTDDAVIAVLKHAQDLQDKSCEPLTVDVMKVFINSLEFSCSDLLIRYNSELNEYADDVMNMTRDLILSDEIEEKIYVDDVNASDMLNSVYNQLVLVPEWETKAAKMIGEKKEMLLLDNGNWLCFDYYA